MWFAHQADLKHLPYRQRTKPVGCATCQYPMDCLASMAGAVIRKKPCPTRLAHQLLVFAMDVQDRCRSPLHRCHESSCLVQLPYCGTCNESILVARAVGCGPLSLTGQALQVLWGQTPTLRETDDDDQQTWDASNSERFKAHEILVGGVWLTGRCCRR